MKLYGIKRVRLLGLLSSKMKIWAVLFSNLKSFLFIKVTRWTLSFPANQRLKTIILYCEELDLFKEISLSTIVFDYLEVRGDLNMV
jgi:hypothetical protein